jgi:hypothetical protein
MSDYRIGFTFTDILWDDEGDEGEIIGKTDSGRWIVRWKSGPSEVSYETEEYIADMIRGYVI